MAKDLHTNSLESYHDLATFKKVLDSDKVLRMADAPSFRRGWNDAAQDTCENAPLASVGGEDLIFNMRPPDYIAVADEAEYLAGYRASCLNMYGVDWEFKGGRDKTTK